MGATVEAGCRSHPTDTLAPTDHRMDPLHDRSGNLEGETSAPAPAEGLRATSRAAVPPRPPQPTEPLEAIPRKKEAIDRGSEAGARVTGCVLIDDTVASAPASSPRPSSDVVVEVFAGCARLSKHLADDGWVAVAVDWGGGTHHPEHSRIDVDLTTQKGEECLWQVLKRPGVRHFAWTKTQPASVERSSRIGSCRKSPVA